MLTFDGPGQGAALVQQGLTIRADWGSVITPVLDQLLERPEVDPDRVALVGLSLGAHLAPRAASTEHRLAACIADCGSFDLYAGALARVPGPLAEGLEDPHGVKGRALEAVLGLLARQPTGGWALRRGMLVHGVDSPLAYLRSLKEFSLVGHAEQIRCPTLVCYAEDDDISASAPQLFEALHCPKRLVRFSRAEGAGDHCESGARLLFHARAFGWLERHLTAHTLSKTRPARLRRVLDVRDGYRSWCSARARLRRAGADRHGPYRGRVSTAAPRPLSPPSSRRSLDHGRGRARCLGRGGRWIVR